MGAEGLLSGWWSAFLPLLPPLSLSQTRKSISIQRHACKKEKKKKSHRRAHIQCETQRTRHTWKKLVCQTLCAHMHNVICRTSPSQPEDKGAVVARQQVSLAPTHLEAANAPTIFQWLPTSSWSHTPCSTPKDKEGEKDSLMELKTQTWVRCRRRQIQWPSTLCWMWGSACWAAAEI